MNERILARRYTKAFTRSGDSSISLTDLDQSISLISAIMDNKVIYHALNSPALSPAQKLKMISSIVHKASGSQAVLNFLTILVEKKRSTLFPYIKEELIEQLAIIKNVTDVAVYVPKEATDEAKNAIIAQLKRFVPKDLNCTFLLDDSLIGGYKAIIGNTVYDGSIKTVLQQLKQSMLVKC